MSPNSPVDDFGQSLDREVYLAVFLEFIVPNDFCPKKKKKTIW